MPLIPGVMCSLCFGHIYGGEHRVDENGVKWDSHYWCHHMDLALTMRKRAAQRRAENGLPEIED